MEVSAAGERRSHRPGGGPALGAEPLQGHHLGPDPQEPLQVSKPRASILPVHRIPWENLVAKSVEHKIHHFKMDIQYICNVVQPPPLSSSKNLSQRKPIPVAILITPSPSPEQPQICLSS